MSFNTCFTYFLDQESLTIAKEGLESLYVAMPYVFVFVPEIKSVYVQEYAWEFKRGNIK